jgi:hypothetical protein
MSACRRCRASSVRKSASKSAGTIGGCAIASSRTYRSREKRPPSWKAATRMIWSASSASETTMPSRAAPWATRRSSIRRSTTCSRRRSIRGSSSVQRSPAICRVCSTAARYARSKLTADTASPSTVTTAAPPPPAPPEPRCVPKYARLTMNAMSTAASRYGAMRRIQCIMAIGQLAYHTPPVGPRRERAGAPDHCRAKYRMNAAAAT